MGLKVIYIFIPLILKLTNAQPVLNAKFNISFFKLVMKLFFFFFASSALIQHSSPISKKRDASPPPSPPCHVTSLQRQDSGSHGIKGILKKTRSTSVESDHSEGSAPPTPARQGSITLSHPQSDEEVEKEVEMDEDSNGENCRDEGSLSEDTTDGVCFSANRRRAGARSSSSSGSFEEMRSLSPDGSLDQSSSVSEDVEELEISLDGSQGSSLKQRSLNIHKHKMHQDDKQNFKSLPSIVLKPYTVKTSGSC